MKKLVISKLWLYRYRFIIGYSILGIAIAALVLTLPLISPGGLSDGEVESAAISYNTHFSSLINGELIDLPYHALQKLSILIFGPSAYAIKLPSMLIGLGLAVLLILLLNRWFKTNVALLASIITVLSVPFLYLAGLGTPLIMLVFWPTLLLWLGSKIQGKERPKPVYCFVAAGAVLLSIFTPHLIYLAIFIAAYVLLNPHLRFTLKRLPKIPLVASILLVLSGIVVFTISAIHQPDILKTIFFMQGFSFGKFFGNIGTAFAPFFSWGRAVEGVFLAPMVGMASFVLAIIGLASTIKGFFASRNAIASCLLVFAIILAGFEPSNVILIVLPLAILIAHGLRYLLEKWYGLFPENPYARVFALFPLTILLGIVIVSDLTHFIFGYRYSPVVAIYFNNDLELVDKNLKEGDKLLIEGNQRKKQFYEILGERKKFEVIEEIPKNFQGTLATFGKNSSLEGKAEIRRIITSPKSDNSDRIYLYGSISQDEKNSQETNK